MAESRFPTDNDTGAKNLVDIVQNLQRQINALSATVSGLPDSITQTILGGATSEVDTLKELADLISANKGTIESLETLAGKHIRYDVSQSLTSTEKSQARSNIDAPSTSDIPAVPNALSAFTNDVGYITGVAWSAVTSKPSTFAPSAHSHTASDVSGLATVATSGSYNDLSDKPTIPTLDALDGRVSTNETDISTLKLAVVGGVKYTSQSLTDAQKRQARTNIGAVGSADIPEPTWDSVSGKPTFATVATSGSYSDLSNTPTIPTVPTAVSAFTNDAGYLTESDVVPVSSLATVAQTNSYNDLDDKPTIPDYSANISALNLAVAGGLKYTAQSLTEEQQAQARANIGITGTGGGGITDLDCGLVTDSIED